MPDRTVLDNSDIVFVYDGSYQGLFTAIFDAVYARIVPADIVSQDRLQLTFNTRYIEVTTDPSKSGRVTKAAREKLGGDAMKKIYFAFLSSGEHREIAIYHYLMLGFKIGRRANNYLTDKFVFMVSTLSQNVSRETDKLMGFIRFSIMEGEAQYCRFSPENNILPLILSHFVARFSSIPLVIHDTKHCLLGVYDTKEKYIISAEGFIPPNKSADEESFEDMWKLFYNTIGIKERKNPKLMKQMMPARYFRHYWEM
ncbi:MAG: TIGR03915 family putative DNA repair protein [Clostridia bacterium]